VLNTGDTIQIIDTSAGISIEIANLVTNVAKIDSINSVNDTLSISMTASQFNSLDGLLNAGDTIKISDTAAGISTELANLVTNIAKVDAINASDNSSAIDMDASQFNSLDGALATNDTINIIDTSANITTELAELVTNVAQIDAINSSNDGTGINLTASQFNSLDGVLSDTNDTINIIDTAAGISTELANLVTNIAKVDAINASDNSTAINMDASQFNSLDGVLATNDNIQIVDSGATIAAGDLTNVLTLIAKVDKIDFSNNAVTLTATQAATVGLGAVMTAADVVTITATKNGAQTLESGVFTSNDVITLSGAALAGATGYVASSAVSNTITGNGATVELVSGAGAVASGTKAQLIFDTTTGILTFDADGAGVNAATTVLTLTGVSSLVTTNINFVA